MSFLLGVFSGSSPGGKKAIFTLKDTKYFDLQMLFILLSLSSIVIYKLMFLKKLNKKENFDNNTNKNAL